MATRTAELRISAVDDTQRAFRSVQRRLDTFSRAARRLPAIGAGLAALGSGAALRGIITTTDAIGKAAQTANVSAEELQRLRFAFGQLAGTGTRDVDLALQRFNRRLGLSQKGTKSYADAFAELGVSINQHTQPALMAALESLAKIESGSERAAQASQIFGEEAGPKIAVALAGGISALNDLKELLPEVVTDENVQAAAEVNDEFDKLSKTFTAGLANSVLQNSNALLALANGLSAVTVAAINGAGAIGRFFGGVEAMTIDEIDAELERLKEADKVIGGKSGGALRAAREERRAQLEARKADLLARAQEREQQAAALEEALPVPAVPDDPFKAIRNLDPILKLNAEIKKIRDLFEQLKEDPEALAELGGLDRVQANVDAAIAAIEGEIEALSQSPVLKSLEDGLAQSITRGVTDGADGALSAFTSLLQQMALKALQTNLSSILSGALGGLGGALSGIPVIGGLFPARERGGTVTQGRSYLVGERGPELFTPGLTGSIAPAGSFEVGNSFPERQGGGTATQGRSHLLGERSRKIFSPGMTGSTAPRGSFGVENFFARREGSGSATQRQSRLLDVRVPKISPPGMTGSTAPSGSFGIANFLARREGEGTATQGQSHLLGELDPEMFSPSMTGSTALSGSLGVGNLIPGRRGGGIATQGQNHLLGARGPEMSPPGMAISTAPSGTSENGNSFPRRERGGTVTQGQSYLVGERGPELFTPGMTGSIAPAGSFGAGFTYAPVVTINGGATEQDRQLFANALEAQKAEIFEALARRSA